MATAFTHRFQRHLAASALAALLCPVFVSPLPALELLPERVDALRLEAAACIVKIEGTDRQGQLVGTGFFIDPTGTIATSYSVGGEADEITVTAGALRLPARRLVADARSGLALLKVDAGTPCLIMRDDFIPEGVEVVAFGFPMGGQLQGGSGKVVSRQFRNGDRFFATTHLRALVPAQPGMGGAPLLDAEGRVVGIIISKTETSLGCFALPGRAVLKILSDHRRFGEVRHGWLGVELAEIDPADAGPPAKIAALAEGGPAAASGLKPGDLIRGVGDFTIGNAYDLLDATFFLTAGNPVNISVERSGKTLVFELVAGDHPAAGRVRSGGSVPTRGLLPVSDPR